MQPVNHIHLELKNVSKAVLLRVNSNKVRTQILSSLDLNVQKGELVTIMGTSGSGKTTLLRLINRLSEIDSGNILLNGEDIRDYDPMGLRRKIGMVFQVPVVFKGSVRDNLAFGIKLWGTNIDIEALARDVVITNDLLEAEAEQLSVGEKQRVCIARALANNPERNLTLLWVTHEGEQAERIGGRRLILKDGRLEEYHA